RVAVPAKMTSSILPPRSVLAPCSPITQARPSTTFDLPDPFGPTTHVTPFSKAKVVGWANDLNPLRVKLFRCTGHLPPCSRLASLYATVRRARLGSQTLQRLAPRDRPFWRAPSNAAALANWSDAAGRQRCQAGRMSDSAVGQLPLP